MPEESPNKLFVGGLPCEWPEQAVRLLLEPWGAIKAFNLVMDKTTGNSKVRGVDTHTHTQREREGERERYRERDQVSDVTGHGRQRTCIIKEKETGGGDQHREWGPAM